MKIGDLVRYAPVHWGTPLEDRPLFIVVQESIFVSDEVGSLINVQFPGESDVYSIDPQTLEVVNENW